MRIKNNDSMQDIGVIFGNETDSTLKKSGYAADAKVTGERISELSEQIEKNGVSDQQIASAVEKYLDENPIDTGVDFETDNSLILKDGILSVNTADAAEPDNTLPITSAAVASSIGNIEVLLSTI